MRRRAKKNTHTPLASEAIARKDVAVPFFPAAYRKPAQECGGWLQDKESLTKRAAEHYLANALGATGHATTLRTMNSGKWYIWTVDTTTGTFEIGVSVVRLPDYLIVREYPGVGSPRCEYEFVCTTGGDIRFITRQCTP
ncbi:MAG: hypothetical protein H6569_01485 [Lewinellaceae bacterium]|nr:hypothetical protein [Lewinellaceae bacterium]